MLQQVRHSASFILIVLAYTAQAVEYYGTHIGTLRNESLGMSGDVYVANGTYLQIPNFTFTSLTQKFNFYFSSETALSGPAPIYKWTKTPGGDYLKKTDRSKKTFNNEHVVIGLESGTIPDWKFFGAILKDQSVYVSVLRMPKEVPEEFCCIHEKGSQGKGFKGQHHGVSSDPIRIIDSRTFFVPKFSFRGQEPPDGWFFAGGGKLEKETGRKALLVGKDTLGHHCAMHEAYKDVDVYVQLPEEQSVYDVNYLSVFCYEYAEDFGHVTYSIEPKRTPVPAYLPPILDSHPKLENIPCE